MKSWARLAVMAGIILLGSFVGCNSSHQAAEEAEVREPSGVIRAYFDAWGRSDWTRKASYMDKAYANMVPEPVNFIRPLWISRIKGDAASAEYRVVFFVSVKGRGVSMESGLYSWSYTLHWNEGQTRWLITNYGEA